MIYMAKRKIIKIDEEKCNGCGVCIPNCPEGALQVIDDKARLISDIFCDGLGACIGHCPQEAITTEEREAEEYDEKKTMENIVNSRITCISSNLLTKKLFANIPIPTASKYTLSISEPMVTGISRFLK